jgi:hypothetical protein
MRNGGLATAGDHVDVHLAQPQLGLEVDRRHAVGADGRRGQVDHQHAQLVELAAVLGVHIGAGGVEGDLDAVFHDVGNRPSTPSAVVLRPISRARLRPSDWVDADHPHRLQHRAALQLVQQVGADIARPDQRAFDLFAHGFWLQWRKGGSRDKAQAGFAQPAHGQADMVSGDHRHQRCEGAERMISPRRRDAQLAQGVGQPGHGRQGDLAPPNPGPSLPADRS